MKTKLVVSHIAAALLLSHSTFALASPFFNVSATGTTLNITTTTSNHTYPSAGIKINSPGNFSPASGCTPQANGYCTFSVSNTTPATIVINGSTTTMNISLCLNGLGPLSCQNYNIGITGPVLYAATKYGTVEVSNNRGASWTPTSQPGGNTGANLWIYNNVIYMGSPAGNVEKSTNNGASWSATGAQPDGSTVISVFTNNGTTLYAGTQDGNLAISTNSGQTWTLATVPYHVSDSLGNVPVTGIFVSGNTIYVATGGQLGDSNYYSKVLASTNGGQTWNNITPSSYVPPTGSPPTPPDPTYYGTFVSVFVSGSTLYAETTYGHTFTSSTTNLSPTSWTDHFDSGTPYPLNIKQLYVQAGTPNTLYGAGDSFIYRSNDNGDTWDFSLFSPDNATAYGIYLNGNTLYSDTYLGNLAYLDITNPDAGWTNTTEQPGGGLPYGLSIASNSTLYVGEQTGALSSLSNGSQAWANTRVNPNLTAIYSTLIDGSTIYAGDHDGNFWKYASDEWRNLNNSLEGAVLSLAQNGSTLYAGITNGIIEVSTDGGNTWILESAQPDGSGVCSLVAISGSADLYAGTQNGNVEFSNNSGASWAALTQPDGSAVNGLAVDTSTTPYTLYAGTANGNVKISTDSGATWTATSSKPDGYAILGLVARSP